MGCGSAGVLQVEAVVMNKTSKKNNNKYLTK